jgi:Putative Ig domain
MLKNSPTSHALRRPWLLSACVLALLSACGGGDTSSALAEADSTAAPLASATTILTLDSDALPDEAAQQLAAPAFHAAPLLLDAPDDSDADGHGASALRGPRVQALPAGAGALSTRGLTVQALQDASRSQALAAAPLDADGKLAPLATGTTVSTYTPAQIRAAYGLPALPAAGTAPTATQAAQMGAGQTIYIVNARHNPNVAAELAAFNTKFGLPACSTKAIAVNAPLPLAAASKTACELSVAYATPNATMTATAPAYDAGWATEIALDVQWAHATAPLARIVLVEAVDPSLNSLLGAIKLANAMGPGVVSMSFGATEGNWTASVDSAFTAPRMSYLAATGDNGASVSWPSVSSNVVAVGGTTLSYSGSGARSEVAWSGTGGGMSAYTAKPAYQSPAVPGLGTVARRNVADVAFNADPSSGQYTAVIKPGSSTVNWMSIGGTSLSTPQWAGLVAVANAMRALSAKAELGAPHALLYGGIAAVPGTYADAFADITKGSHGACTTCSARIGYDPLTGLGTPNATGVLAALSGAAVAPQAPVVTAATISGKVGTALSFAVAVTAPNPVSYGLAGAPSGMSISAAGVVSWAKPVAGNYSVTVTAKDGKTGLSGQGVYTVQIAGLTSNTGPSITAAAMTGVAGKALSGKITLAAPGATSLQISISGVPMGMAFSASGLTLTATWPVPVTGSYSLKLTVVDSAGKTATAAIPVTIKAK